MGSKAGLRTLVVIFLAVIWIGMFCIVPVAAPPSVLRVPDPYGTIHEAIDAASPGDTIIVSEGFYREREIEIYKPLILIAEGEVVLDGELLWYWWEEFDRIRAVFLVTSNDVTIRGFTLLGPEIGVLLYDIENGRHVNNCRIEQNRIESYWCGVFAIGFGNIVRENSFGHNMFDILLGGLRAEASGYNLVENNAIMKSGVGIIVHGNSHHNIIRKNSIARAAIMLQDGTHNNMILKNEITDSSGVAIEIASSHRNTIKRNVISRNAGGIHLHGSSECNVIRDNKVSNNGGAGICLQRVSHNLVKKNKVEKNQDGIYLESSDDNILEKNTVKKNTRYGITITVDSSYNTIKKNKASRNGEFDLYWDGTGTDNVWTKNKYKSKSW